MKFTLTHMTGSKAGQTEVLEGPVITIGRGEGNQLRYDPHQDDKVSTFHARLEGRDGQVFLVDLDSSNGTLVNGSRIQGSVPLVSGAVLTFGAEGGPNLALQFAAEGAPTPPVAGPGPAASPTPALAKTAAVAVPSGAAPTPAPKPGGGAGKKLLAGGILGTVAMVCLGCLLFTAVVALNRQVRAALPPWAVRIVRKIPGVNKLMKTPQAPRLPGGIRAPRPRLPSGGSAPSSPSPDEDGQSPDEPAPDEPPAEAPAEEGTD